ncbi:MAG: hypothetical protein U0232_28450 [Thermomicrobiales bacterium]
MSHFYAISVPDEGPFRFDVAAFHTQLGARWPEAQVQSDPDAQQRTFELPTIPLGAFLAPDSPGGMRWWVALIGVPDAQEGGLHWRVASEVPGYATRYGISSDHSSVWTDGTNVECAVCALWLRGWLPPEVPLMVSDSGFTRTAVTLDMSLLDLVRRMELDVQEHHRAERAWVEANMEPVPGGWRAADGSIYYSAEGPPGQERRSAAEDLALGSQPPPTATHMDDPVLAAVIREHLYRLLGEEAEQFFVPNEDHQAR